MTTATARRTAAGVLTAGLLLGGTITAPVSHAADPEITDLETVTVRADRVEESSSGGFWSGMWDTFSNQFFGTDSFEIKASDYPWVAVAHDVAADDEAEPAAMSGLVAAYNTTHSDKINRGDTITFTWDNGSTSEGIYVTPYSSFQAVPKDRVDEFYHEVVR